MGILNRFWSSRNSNWFILSNSCWSLIRRCGCGWKIKWRRKIRTRIHEDLIEQDHLSLRIGNWCIWISRVHTKINNWTRGEYLFRKRKWCATFSNYCPFIKPFKLELTLSFKRICKVKRTFKRKLIRKEMDWSGKGREGSNTSPKRYSQ